MSTLLYSMDATGTPSDAEVVRNTTAVVEMDAPPAEMETGPDFDQVATDPNPHLGMVNRQLASDWHEPIKGSNATAANASAEHNAIVDRQVASAGRAPGLEESSPVFGHGSVAWANGIEPTVRDGAAFGNDYFVAIDAGSQEGIPQVMTVAPGWDRTTVSESAAAGKERSRDATTASTLYSAYYNAMVG